MSIVRRARSGYKYIHIFIFIIIIIIIIIVGGGGGGIVVEIIIIIVARGVARGADLVVGVFSAGGDEVDPWGEIGG